MGGIGKSTLAAQIAARVGRLQPGRVMSVLTGEVPAPSPIRVPARPRRAAGLLTVVSGRELAVHRWTAEQLRHKLAEPVNSATAVRDRAAAWVAGQVSRGAIMACDPAMCAALAHHGAAGQQLLQDPHLRVTPSARAALAVGRVDARLLITLAALAASEPAREPLRVTGFGAADPGASPGLPLRTARLAAPGGAAHRMLAFLRAQRSPYQPGYAGAAGPAVTVEFAAPAPLGLLDNH